MIRKHTLAVMALAFTLFTAPLAMAQEAPSHIAVANTGTIFTQMKETVDLRQKMEADRNKLQTQLLEKQGNLKALKSTRDELKEGSPQWNDRNLQLMEESIKLDNWQRYETARVQQQEKIQTKQLFEKIQAAIATVAKQRNIDIVLTAQATQLPPSLEQINMEQLRMAIASINVLYVDPKSDITDAVIAQLDSEYSTAGTSSSPK